MKFAALALLVACSAPPRPPLPRVNEAALKRNEEGVDLLAARHMVDAELHANATAFVLQKAQRRAMARRRP